MVILSGNLPEYREYKRMMAAHSSTSTPITLSTSATRNIFSTTPFNLTRRSTTSKPPYQMLFSYTLDGEDSLLTSLCKNISDSDGTLGWTRIFCYTALFLTIICAIIYAVRSLYSLSLMAQQKNLNRNFINGQRTNRDDSPFEPADEQELSRMFPLRSDLLHVRAQRTARTSPLASG